MNIAKSGCIFAELKSALMSGLPLNVKTKRSKTMKTKPQWKVIIHYTGIVRYFYDFHFAVNWANRTSYYTGCPVKVSEA
jgi:hypothetical protein